MGVTCYEKEEEETENGKNSGKKWISKKGGKKNVRRESDESEPENTIVLYIVVEYSLSWNIRKYSTAMF
jgi:hypothetical protein